MRRMSILPISAMCGGAAALGATLGGGRPAAMSTAFHAWQARAEGWQVLMARLTDIERTEVESWKTPVTVVLENAVLDYAEAEKEVWLGLDEMGFYCDSLEDSMSVGHMDFAWVVDGVAYVGDIKKTVWTTADGPDSLQLHAYGWAYAQKNNCHSYVAGLWLATEGEWLWAKEAVTLASKRGAAIFERIRAAAMAEGEFSTGVHCRSCWSRSHCPEWALPVALAPTWLGPVAGGNLPTDSVKATALVLQLQHAEEVLGKAKKNLQEAVRRGTLQVKDPESGKVWGPVEMTGRDSVSIADLRAKMGPEAENYIRRGAPYSQFRWLRERP